jgi:hypothetical protein
VGSLPALSHNGVDISKLGTILTVLCVDFLKILFKNNNVAATLYLADQNCIFMFTVNEVRALSFISTGVS